MSDRVRIGTCSGLADAALVRSVFAAHGIHVVVGTEHHASVFTALGGGFISLDIWVDENDQEDAEALLRDLRERGAQDSDWDGHEGEDDGQQDSGSEGPEAIVVGDHDEVDDDAHDHWNVRGAARSAPSGLDDADDEGPRAYRERIDRRRGTAIALLLGCVVTFGTAHAFTRAWLRFLVLAATEIVGVVYLFDGHPAGKYVIIATIATDVIGAVWRVQTAPRSFLPGLRRPKPGN